MIMQIKIDFYFKRFFKTPDWVNAFLHLHDHIALTRKGVLHSSTHPDYIEDKKSGDESKTQSTNPYGKPYLADRATSCIGGILKTVVEIHGGKQIGTDSQLEGYSLIH